MSHYWIQLHTLPRPRHLPQLTRAIVYQGHPGTAVAATAAYAYNAGTGVAAAIKDAWALIDDYHVADWFNQPNEVQVSHFPSKVLPVITVPSVESETPMVKDYLRTYTTAIVVAGMILAIMKGCM